MASDPEAILFDLGGVLIEWPGIDALVALSGGQLTLEEARRRWLLSYWVRRHETGLCTPEEFAAGVVDELSLVVSPRAFLDAFMGWRRGPLPGAIELVAALASKFLLACLSNVSAVHWKLHDDDPHSQALLAPMRHRFLSHEIGLLKPDRKAFDHVVRHLPSEPARTLFFDDNRECVEAARQAGFRAFEVQGVEAVRAVLHEVNAALAT